MRRAVLPLLCSILAAQAPIQPAGPAMAMAEELPPSTVALPIQVDLASLFRQVEAMAPRTPPNVETWAEVVGKPRTYFRFNMYREPLDLRLVDNRLYVSCVANFGMDIGVKTLGNMINVVGSCGRAPEPFRRVAVDLRTELNVRPDWGFELRNTVIKATPLNPCQVTWLGYDITDQVAEGMKENLAKAAQMMEQMVRDNALLRQKAQEAWSQFSQPLELQKGVWLVINPERVRLAPMKTQNGILTLTAEVDARPMVVLGERPAVIGAALPPLELRPSAQPGFRVRVDADLPYTQASAQLAGQMVGKKFETPKGAFEVTTAAVRGEKGLVLMEIGLKGRINGKMTLAGRPVVNPQTNTLQLADLDFTLESKSWIAKLGDWIYHTNLKKMLGEKANFFVDQQFQGLRDQVQSGMNRPLAPNLALSGALRSLRLERVLVLDQGFKATAYLDGEVQVAMR